MSDSSKASKNAGKAITQMGDTLKSCFVIMPLSNVDGYSDGHFQRVFDYLIKPAALTAGYLAVKANDVYSSNLIILDVIKQVYESDLVICDMSSLNPNSLYEVGIRQAFDKPVVLLKDKRTPRIFDIQGMRDVEYDEALRVDYIEPTIKMISQFITETVSKGGKDINSVVRLLGINAASVKTTEVSPETKLVIESLSDIRREIEFLKRDRPRKAASNRPSPTFVGVLHNEYSFAPGDLILFRSIPGRFIGFNTHTEEIWIETNDGIQKLPFDETMDAITPAE